MEKKKKKKKKKKTTTVDVRRCGSQDTWIGNVENVVWEIRGQTLNADVFLGPSSHVSLVRLYEYQRVGRLSM